MAIGFERQQKSLIGANLPTARLDIQPADFSGIQRLGNAIMNAGARIGDERARRKEQGSAIADAMKGAEAGAAYGSSWIGKDENGNPVEFTLPEGSDAFQRGFLQGAEGSLDAKFRASLENGLNGIQNEFTEGKITKEEADARMQAYAEGQLEGTPAYRRGYYSELTQTEILQRSGLMGSQQASRRAQLVAEDQTTIIKDQINKAAAQASAGGDAAPFFTEIDKAYDTLLAMNRIGKEAAASGKAAVRQLVTGQALVNRLTTALAKGEIDPTTIDRFGTAIETNDATAEAVVQRRYQVGPGAKSSIPQGYKAKDVFGKIDDENLRKEIGQKLRQAATDWKQQATANANAQAFTDQLAYLASDNGRLAALPSEYHDDADEMMGTVLVQANPFENPTVEAAILQHIGQTKYLPKPLSKALESMAGSLNPEEVQKAVQLYRKIATLTNEQGIAVGDMLVAGMSDDARNLLSNIDEGFRLGMSASELVENFKTARGREEFTLGRLIATYNANAEDDDGFYKRLRTQWSDDYDVLPDPEVKDAFGTAFRHSMIALRDPEKAFAKAYEMVKGKYRKSDIMLSGLESGSGLLTNPDGYEVQQSGLFGAPSGSEYEWLNNTVRGDVVEAMTSGSLVMPGRPGEDEMTPEGFTKLLESPNWIGTTAKLVPVQGSNPDMPEYSIRMFSEEGEDLGPLLQTDERGRVSPLTINPHLERSQANVKFSAQAMLKANEAAANESLMRLEDRIMNQLTPEQQGGFKGDIPLSDYLPSVAPQLTEEYRLERSQIEEGLINARKLYEEQTGEVPPPSKIGPQTLVTPRAAGFDVAATAASLVDRVLPDGTGGTFLLRIAAQESNFGKAAGTFRLRGDKGITQVNTGSGFREVKRRVAMGEGRVWAAAQKVKRELGIDIDQITAADLDKPLVAMTVARLYVEAVGRPVPQDVAGQAAWWKRHYNTYLGAGSPEEFMRSARKVPDNWQSRVKLEG